MLGSRVFPTSLISSSSQWQGWMPGSAGSSAELVILIGKSPLHPFMIALVDKAAEITEHVFVLHCKGTEPWENHARRVYLAASVQIWVFQAALVHLSRCDTDSSLSSSSCTVLPPIMQPAKNWESSSACWDRAWTVPFWSMVRNPHARSHSTNDRGSKTRC